MKTLWILAIPSLKSYERQKKEQHKQRFQYGQLYQRNYYKEVREKSRVYYKLYSLNGMQKVSEDYTEISLVCVRQDGMYLGREALDWMCRSSWDTPQ